MQEMGARERKNLRGGDCCILSGWLTCLSTGRHWVYIENTRPFPGTQLLSPGHGDGSNNFDGRPEVHPVNVPYQWNSGPLSPVVPYPVRFDFRSSPAIYAHPPFYYTTRYSNPPALLDNK